MESASKPGLRYTLFGAVILLALGWAWSTNHVWEDYYITFRSSKNLATGHGLVFNVGDRLHTFTSPLGVLLPAAASYLTGNHSDTSAIWLFRVWSAAALAGAVLLLLAVARRYRYGGWVAAVLAAFVALDAKSLDFTTNGMETGFLLLFIAYTLWAMFVCPGRRWLHLGLAWGALMWTRPDSFLYIGLLAAGAFFFNDPARSGLTRGQWFKLFFQAGLLCTLIYLPWLEWAWWYYGTPVPHTITAKGGVSTEARTIGGILSTLVTLPLKVWKGSTSLEATFLPSYFQIGGWPVFAVVVARAVAVLLAFQWVVPFWRQEVRVASFAYCGMHVYLTYFPFFPFPWYLPGTTLLAAVTLGGMLAQLWDVAGRDAAEAAAGARSRRLKVAVVVVAVAALGGELWLTWQMRREMAAEQIYSATGVRRKVGEWLKANAQPGDTVFMEPLGHIGYFSGLKTYDFPGLSSKEMTDAVRAVGTNWAYLIDYLSPEWVVLRPQEFERVRPTIPWLFGEGKSYRLVQEFNNLPQIRQLDVHGRSYIAFDAHMLVFHRQVPSRNRAATLVKTTLARAGLAPVELKGQPLYRSPVNRALTIRLPESANHVWITYGIPESDAPGGRMQDTVEFTVDLSDGPRKERLFSRKMGPQLDQNEHRVPVFTAQLPRHSDQAVLILTAAPKHYPQPVSVGCWGEPEYVP
jgi:hypothetical protein